jgi:competence ComEA-like helix-hairpin-helix protein
MLRLLTANTIFLNFVLMLLLICTPGQASFEDLGIGARQQGMGEAVVGFVNSSDAIFWNPAGLAGTDGFEASTYFSRPFGLKELAHNTLSLTAPVGKFNTGIGIQSFGYSAYRENSFAVAIAGNYQQKLSVGITLKYLSLSIKNYGSDATVGLDAGLLVNYSPRLAFGFMTKNFNRPRIGSQHQYLPQIFVTGVLLRPYANLNLTFDIYKDIRFPFDPRAGIEYRLFNKFFLRAGTAWEPARYSLGFGLNGPHFQIDYAFYSHPTLNLTHLFSVTFTRAESRQPPGPSEEASLSEKFPKKPAKPDKFKPGESININTAGVDEFCRLPGIGASTAKKIIAYREAQGGFINLTELTQIKGIGSSKFKKLLPYLRLKD